MTPQWIRFAIEELLGPGVYMAPTYGNTLMGLAAAEMPTAGGRLQDRLLRPASRAPSSRLSISTITTSWSNTARQAA